MSAQQNSVMVALAELSRIESDRIAGERAAEADRQRQERERRQKEEAERADLERHRLRVAEAEARLRVAEEVRAADAVQRAQRIEDELRVVKAEKAVLAEQLFAPPPVVTMPASYKFWRAVTAAMLITVGVASFGLYSFMSKKPSPPEVVIAARPAPILVDDSASRQRIDELERRVRSLMTKDPKDPPVAARAPVRHRPAPGTGVKAMSLSAASVEACENDPLCGMNPK